MSEPLPERWPDGADWPRVANACSKAAGEIRLRLIVAAGCPWTEGHFPGQPVLPGVTLLRWAIHLAGLIRPTLSTVRSIANLKFHAPVLPPAELTLELNLDPDGRRLRFHYLQDGKTCSSGRVYFE